MCCLLLFLGEFNSVEYTFSNLNIWKLVSTKSCGAEKWIKNNINDIIQTLVTVCHINKSLKYFHNLTFLWNVKDNSGGTTIKQKTIKRKQRHKLIFQDIYLFDLIYFIYLYTFYHICRLLSCSLSHWPI